MKQMSMDYVAVGATLPGGPGKAFPHGARLKEGSEPREAAERTAFQAEGTAAAKPLRQKWAQRGDRKPASRWQRKGHPLGLTPGLSSSLFTLGVHASRTRTLSL